MIPAPTITEFLEARISEDEAVAREIADCESHDPPGKGYEGTIMEAVGSRRRGYITVDPARVLAECAAKRAIIEAHPPYYADPDYDRSDVLCGTCGLEPKEEYSPPGAVEYPCPTLKALAAVYAGHPDYGQEWAA